jgi:hypothetical protein
MRTRITVRNKVIAYHLLLLTALISCSCGANEGVLRSGKENAQPTSSASPKTSFESDMDAMKTAGFAFIYVVRRKDRGKMDSGDRSFIKAQTADTNRRVSTDEDKAVMIGSNYQLPEASFTALVQRFLVETVAEPPASNANVNANVNANKAK